jgi:hypothetical protein
MSTLELGESSSATSSACSAELVGGPQERNTADDYFLAGRDLGWILVGASIFCVEHRVRAPRRPGGGRSDKRRGSRALRTARLVRARARLGVLPFYMHSRVFTMPEFLERRFNPASRWILSLISLVAYVLTKIAVGIFAGGVVFGSLMPELSVQIGDTSSTASGWARCLSSCDGPLHRARRHACGRLHRRAADRHPGGPGRRR